MVVFIAAGFHRSLADGHSVVGHGEPITLRAATSQPHDVHMTDWRWLLRDRTQIYVRSDVQATGIVIVVANVCTPYMYIVSSSESQSKRGSELARALDEARDRHCAHASHTIA